MQHRRVAAIAAASLAWMGAAAAAEPPAPQAPAPKTVSEVVVTAIKSVSELVVTAPAKCPKVRYSATWKAGPKVVSTFPAAGQTIRPGLMIVRITFDQPVACAGGLADDPPLSNPCPDAVQHMVLTFDHRTVRTICLVEPGRLYSAKLNAFEDSSFKNLDGVLGEAHQLRFSTSMDPPVTDVCEALRQDVETIAEVEKARPLDCATGHDESQDLVKAQVLARDAGVRQAREAAIAAQSAKADAARAEAQARDLQKAEKLALADYRRARDRAGPERPLAVAAITDVAPEDDRLSEAPEVLGPASRRSGFNRPTFDGVDTRLLPPGARDAAPVARKAKPDLADWHEALTLNGVDFDCRFAAGAVVCQRR